MQIAICVIILAIAIGICVFLYIRQLATRHDIDIDQITSPQKVMDDVTKRLADILKDTTINASNDEEYELIRERKLRIEEAYDECVDGKPKAKLTMKEIIISILASMFPTIEDLYKVFPYDQPAVISDHWKMEILFEVLYPEHKTKTLKYLIHKYNLLRVHYDIEDGTVPSYAIDSEDMWNVYMHEITEPLTYRQALAVTATIVYEQIKGMGIVDTLRTMDINGFNIGASGSIMPNTDPVAMQYPAYRSVWLYFEGKYVHLRFLNFYSMEEVRRVVTLICRYNNPGPLTEKRGYIVNTMEDQSRVLALRPPAAEYWAVFVRRFVLDSHSLHSLVDPPLKDKDNKAIPFDEFDNPTHNYNNTFILEGLIELLMKGQVTSAVTGRQGSGKTTLMTAMFKFVDARFTMRVLEMAPELYLRELYPQRNILSVAETPYVTAAELQDALKKSDAALSIVGEVATDIIAARMIQMGQVASIFTVFSHHANRTVDLVHAITNSVVAASGGSATPATVEPQVIDVIKVDIHLDYDVNGNRYIERVTEIIRLDEKPYPDQEQDETNEEYSIRLNREYYTRCTDRQHFTTRDVLRFDTSTFTYYTTAWFSDELTKHIFGRIEDTERPKWKKFVYDVWGSGNYNQSTLKNYTKVIDRWAQDK